MREADKAAYAEARRAHAAIYEQLLEVDSSNKRTADPKELCDSIFALRETSKLLDDMRREVNKVLELSEKMCCAAWLRGDGQPIRTEYCTGSPDVKQTVKTPKEGTPEYAKLLEHFGVPAGTPFRPHWPDMKEYVSAEITAGRPIPPGCDPHDTWTIFKVGTRRRRDILEDAVFRVADPDLLRRVRDAMTELKDGDPLEAQRMLHEALVEQGDRNAQRDEEPDVISAAPAFMKDHVEEETPF